MSYRWNDIESGERPSWPGKRAGLRQHLDSGSLPAQWARTRSNRHRATLQVWNSAVSGWRESHNESFHQPILSQQLTRSRGEASRTDPRIVTVRHLRSAASWYNWLAYRCERLRHEFTPTPARSTNRPRFRISIRDAAPELHDRPRAVLQWAEPRDAALFGAEPTWASPARQPGCAAGRPASATAEVLRPSGCG